jgi:hypothetical protein
MIRRLLPLIGVVIALIPGAQSAKATSEGLTVTGYIITEAPPALDLSSLTQCGQETPEFVNIVFEYDPIGQCPTDLFLAHYQGFLTLPEGTETVRFWLAADDGGLMNIAGVELGQWIDQGCSAYETEEITTLPDGVPLTLEGYFYENGGGTCFMLAWSLNGGQLTIVPPSAFTTSGNMSPPTSSTSTSTTTSTTSTSTTTSTTTTTTAAPQTTTSTSTSTTTSTTSTSTTTSTTEPAQTTTTTEPAQTTTTSTSTTEPAQTTTTSTTPKETEKPTYTAAEAVNIATDPAQVAQLSSDEAEAVFETLNIEDLTVEQADAVVEAVQAAPVAVREAFEEKINIFSGASDKYIPLGSKVPVSTRRVVIITTGLLVSIPTIRKR